MKRSGDFRFDLMVGKLGEDYLSAILEDKKVEVKTDFLAHKTGNVFVEYKSRGQKSGISISQSDFYAFIISNENILLIETVKLKKLCRGYLGTERDVKGGDHNTSFGILLPLTDLIT